ncbi:hypothetical protein C1H46_011146 [Malus baccata]|uniref:C2H2-type domain-containing protein n=1 Tax=Malus baccata TaxID=106549 RepID=A0A540MWS5_MALBA|nr:hypothetical protein C1H46_011146 [Malus baccata]
MEAKDEIDHDFLTPMNSPPPPPPPYPRHPNSSLPPSPSHSSFNNLTPSIGPSSHQIPTHSQPPATPHACRDSSSTAAATRSFPCSYCPRKFNSYQALGGHQRAHKSERAAARRSFVGAGGDGCYPSLPTHSPRHPHHVPTVNVPPAPSQIMPISSLSPPPPYPRHPNSSLPPSPSHSPFNNLPPSIRPSSHQIPTHSQPLATPHACRASSSTAAATHTFPCSYCSRKFNSYQALGGHQRTHKSERAAARRSFVGPGGDGGYPSLPTHSPRHPHYVPTFNVPPAPSQFQIMPRQPHDVDDHAQHSYGPHQYHQLQQSHQQQQPEAAVHDSSSFLIETGHFMQQDNQPPKYSWVMDLSNINTTNYHPHHLIPAAASTYSLPQMIHGPTTNELPQTLFSSAPPSSHTHQYYHGHPQNATAAHSPGDNDTPHSLDLSLHL